MAVEIPQVHLRQQVGAALCAQQVRVGSWVRVRPGAYVESPDGEPWQRRRALALATAAAVARQLTDVTLSHESAALVHGLALWRLPEHTAVVARTNPRSGLGKQVRRHRCALDAADVVEVDGLAVTSLPRTMLDCARLLHPRDALVVVDSGLRALVLPRRSDARSAVEDRTEPIVTELLERVAPRSRGAVRARAVLRAADPLAESAPESVVRWIALSRGLPRPLLQEAVITPRGTFFTDLAWRPDAGRRRWLHVELDGASKYRDDPRGRDVSDLLLAERRREASIQQTEATVIRIYPDDLADPDHVYRMLRARITPAHGSEFVPVPGLLPHPLG